MTVCPFCRSALRNWQFQVSKDGMTWTTLYNHENDCSLNEPGSVDFHVLKQSFQTNIMHIFFACDFLLCYDCYIKVECDMLLKTFFSFNLLCSSTMTWPIETDADETQGWRHIRLQQMGKNASGQTHYLSLSGFEIYGTVTGVCDDIGKGLCHVF